MELTASPRLPAVAAVDSDRAAVAPALRALQVERRVRCRAECRVACLPEPWVLAEALRALPAALRVVAEELRAVPAAHPAVRAEHRRAVVRCPAA